jgi:hypothetical protein
MVVHTYNPNAWEVEAVGLGARGQPGLHSQTSSQKKKKKNLDIQLLVVEKPTLNHQLE